jgi:hypothetical protein
VVVVWCISEEGNWPLYMPPYIKPHITPHTDTTLNPQIMLGIFYTPITRFKLSRV